VPERALLFLARLRWCGDVVGNRGIVSGGEVICSKWRSYAHFPTTWQTHIEADVPVSVSILNEVLEPNMHSRTS